MDNLHPTFDRLLPRQLRESRLGQRGAVLWMTGLSGSGKTTIALEVEKLLFKQGKLPYVLDGDNIRTGLNKDLGFSLDDRAENIRRIAEVSKLMANAGLICICCFVSPTNSIRQSARDIIGEEDFKLVFINTPIEECERRDVKGLYRKARAGQLPGFTGIDSPFETPDPMDLEVKTMQKTAVQSATEVIDWINTWIRRG